MVQLRKSNSGIRAVIKPASLWRGVMMAMGVFLAMTVGYGGQSGLSAPDNHSPASINQQVVVDSGQVLVNYFDYPVDEVLFRNEGVVSAVISGNEVQFTGLNPGRTGVRVRLNGGDEYFGIRVNHADGSSPGMPPFVAMGSVSEDISGDLAFWEAIQPGQKNKSMDIRYIYINGGPFTGWQSWGPQRPATFASNSLKYGLIPFFVYYNIPDGGESFYTDSLHVNDPAYMEAYFDDLNLFLDQADSVMQGELYGIILEPDFLGYIQQNAHPSDPEQFVTCVGADAIAPGAGNLRTLVERINATIAARIDAGQHIFFGWQLNLWAYPVVGAPQGIIRLTDQLGWEAGRAEIAHAARETTLYAMQSGVLSSGAGFLSIDKYGLDAMGYQNTPDPANSTWFFNHDHWMNYLLFVNQISETANRPVVLWQLPVGHINASQTISAYTGSAYVPLSNTTTRFEDSSTTFFFGDEFNADSPERLNYFSQNQANDQGLQTDGNSITWTPHIEQTRDAGVVAMLMGAGVGISTDGIGNPPTDDYFWIQQVQDYYLGGTTPVNWEQWPDCNDGCNPVVTFGWPVDGTVEVTSTLDPLNLEIMAWDTDGPLSSVSLIIDGQSYPLDPAGYTHLLEWTPPAFDTYTLEAIAVDADGNETSEVITFTVLLFDPDACGVPLWEVNTVYAEPGERVSWDGAIYENMWWTQGDEPGSGGTANPWQFIEPCPVPTAVAESEAVKDMSLNLWPNPANSHVTIRLSLPLSGHPQTVQVSITNLLGQYVMQPQTLTIDGGSHDLKLDVSKIPPGIYFVRVGVSGHMLTGRLVRQP